MHEDPEQGEQAQDHGEGIVVQITGLYVAYNAGPPAHRPRRAVNDEPIDKRDITGAPQQIAGGASAAGEKTSR